MSLIETVEALCSIVETQNELIEKLSKCIDENKSFEIISDDISSLKDKIDKRKTDINF